MKFDDVVLGRRSIRGYKPDPVPKALIAEIIEMAMRAPSSLNTQPWNFYVITGEPLDRIRAGNTERNLAGVPQSREFRRSRPYAGAHRDRQIEIAKQLFAAMGIERDDQEGARTGCCAASASSTRPVSCRDLRPRRSTAATSRPSTAAPSPTRWSTPPGRAAWAA